MAQMMNNPAKEAYLKFDVLAKTMLLRDEPSTETKNVNVKGLLKRLKNKSEDTSENDKKEPFEIALDYFIALREQREKLKQEV